MGLTTITAAAIIEYNYTDDRNGRHRRPFFCLPDSTYKFVGQALPAVFGYWSSISSGNARPTGK